MRKYCLCQREHVKYEFLEESLRQMRSEAASQCDPPSITKQSNKFGVSDLDCSSSRAHASDSPVQVFAAWLEED